MVRAVPALDEGWIRAVLFEHAIDDWIDLGPDPERRQYVGTVYAEQVAACYQAWKWVAERLGADVDQPPAKAEPAEPLRLALAASTWTELMAVLLTVARAQALLYGDLVRQGDETTRRGFDRLVRDCAGHAALGYLELRRGSFVDAEQAQEALARLLPATRGWLESVDAARPGEEALTPSWVAAVRPLLDSLRYEVA